MSDSRPVVLLIDDDPMMRILAVEALGSSGFNVVEADCGEAGVALFAAHVPDVVLLDVVMPGRDGYSVCEDLRKLSMGVGTPILMMTGLDDVPAIDRAYEAGATDFITKPVNYPLLAHRLRYLVRAASAFRDARASARRLGRAQRLARVVQWEMDLKTRSFRWSEEAHEVLGVPKGAHGGGVETLLDMVHHEDRARVASALASPRPHQVEYRIVLPDGSERVVRHDAQIADDEDSGASLLSGAAQDVTELRDAERKARDLACFDTLTGLPNRSFLSSFLAHALTDAARDESMLAILSLGLDGFKRVNDTLGHAAGDALLREVASRIAACIRSGDSLSLEDTAPATVERTLTSESIASRLGGDEFVVVLSHVRSREDAALVARRISDRVGIAYDVGGTQVFISSSIGIACSPEAGTEVDVLLERAEAAMSHAKENGRNQFQFFTTNIQDKARRRMAVESEMRGALARAGIHPRSETIDYDALTDFRLEYQPKVKIPSGEACGVEALLRWKSAELGALSPLEFIPIAEETGLILPLGDWVLRTACAQAKRWADEGRSLRVAVNVSVQQFRDPELPKAIRHALAATGLAPQLLELEITEGMLMQDTAASSAVLTELKSIGVRIALDDFGTGYSSLSYLTRLPIDSLKIDRSFIRDLGVGKSATITSAIIGLSRGLDIDLVVEGVETQAQLDFISKHGAAEIQGYFFARPMSVVALHEWRAARESHGDRAPTSTGHPRSGVMAKARSASGEAEVLPHSEAAGSTK